MENLEILQEKYRDLAKEHQQLQRDYILVVKDNASLRKDVKALRELLNAKQKKEFELNKILQGQIELPIGGK